MRALKRNYFLGSKKVHIPIDFSKCLFYILILMPSVHAGSMTFVRWYTYTSFKYTQYLVAFMFKIRDCDRKWRLPNSLE